MSDPGSGDMNLVERMLGGDERAFEEFFETHFSRLFRFASSRLGGGSDAAEEVTQTTLVRALSRLETYRGEAALFTWLCAICRHEIARYLDRRGRQPAMTGLPEDAQDARAALDSLAMEAGSLPEVSLQRREIARLVQVTLDTLPWTYASALEWKYIREYPVKEIAERLRLSLKAAESLLVRARAAFRDGFTSLASADRKDTP